MTRLSRRAALAAPLALLGPTRAGATTGALHSLHVGIDRYLVRPLQGCVNDARLIERTVKPIAASTTLLLDREATGAGFRAAWEGLVARSRQGDTLLLTFSGHGSRERERIPGSEKDGMDDVLVMAGFDGRQVNDVLLDDELGVLFARAGEQGRRVVFVADCCHAGTMTRSIDPRVRSGRRTRSAYGAYDMNALLAAAPPAPPPPAPASARSAANLVFLAAGLETEEVPEIVWQGRHHGAMSVSFARAIAGEADQDKDGVLSRAELESFVLRSVRQLAEGLQHPSLDAAAGPSEPLLPVASATAPSFDTTPVRVRLLGVPAPDRVLAGLKGAQAGSEDDAELVYDAATREVVAGSDIVARGVPPDALQGAVDRVHALRRLRALALRSPLDVAIRARGIAAGAPEQDRTHRKGTKMDLDVIGRRAPALVVFNLAGTGTVQLLRPDQDESATLPVALDRPLFPDLEVGEPYGADHVVALAMPRPPATLIEALRGLHGKALPIDAALAVQRALDGMEGWQLGVEGIFTGP